MIFYFLLLILYLILLGWSFYFPIIIKSLDSEPPPLPPRLHRADWQLHTDLSSYVRPLSDFADFLWFALLQSVPKMSSHFPKRPVTWWNEVCINAVREKRPAFSRVRRHRGDPRCLEAFQRAYERARLTLKKAQRFSYRLYLSSITVRTPLTGVVNKIRKIGKFSPAPPPPVLIRSMETVEDPKTVADLFAAQLLVSLEKTLLRRGMGLGGWRCGFCLTCR